MHRLAAVAALLPMSLGVAFAMVNVNSAQQSELQRTKGLDRYKAKSLIEYRAQNGALTSLADLGKIPGFNKDVIDKIAPEVAFKGPPFTPGKAESKEKKKT